MDNVTRLMKFKNKNYKELFGKLNEKPQYEEGWGVTTPLIPFLEELSLEYSLTALLWKQYGLYPHYLDITDYMEELGYKTYIQTVETAEWNTNNERFLQFTVFTDADIYNNVTDEVNYYIAVRIHDDSADSRTGYYEPYICKINIDINFLLDFIDTCFLYVEGNKYIVMADYVQPYYDSYTNYAYDEFFTKIRQIPKENIKLENFTVDED